MALYDQAGRSLGELPPDAVKIRAADTSMVSLVGLYIDPDGIVYDPDGAVNEAATALAARAAVSAAIARGYRAPQPWQIEKGSLAEQAEAAATRAYYDSQLDNVFTTAAEIPARIAEAVKIGGSGVLIVLAILAALELSQRAPRARAKP